MKEPGVLARLKGGCEEREFPLFLYIFSCIRRSPLSHSLARAALSQARALAFLGKSLLFEAAAVAAKLREQARTRAIINHPRSFGLTRQPPRPLLSLSFALPATRRSSLVPPFLFSQSWGGCSGSSPHPRVKRGGGRELGDGYRGERKRERESPWKKESSLFFLSLHMAVALFLTRDAFTLPRNGGHFFLSLRAFCAPAAAHTRAIVFGCTHTRARSGFFRFYTRGL